jgi:hypothetical protein
MEHAGDDTDQPVTYGSFFVIFLTFGLYGKLEWKKVMVNPF